MRQLTFDPVGGYLFVALIAGVLFGLLWFGPDRARTTGKQRLTLTALRAGLILLLLLAMLRPAQVIKEMKRQAATLVIMVDRSRSMLVGDALGGKSRWEELEKLLRDSAPALKKLREEQELEVQLYGFDSQVAQLPLDPGELDLGGPPSGDQTAIGASLEEVLRKEAGKRLVGVIVLSDGAQNAYPPNDLQPQTVVRRMKLDYPVYTFAFGQPLGGGQTANLALKDLITSSTVFVKNQLDVASSLRVDGYAGREIPVELLFETRPGEMEAVGAMRVEAKAEGAQVPIELSHIPEVPGEHKLTIRAAAQDGEQLTTDNELSTFVTVLKGGLNVLYLEGALRVEQRFLRSSIDASPNIELQFERYDRDAAAGRKMDVDDWFEPGKFDVYLVGDLDSTAIAEQDWQKLAEAVDAGAGLMMIGGYHSFGPGGYDATPLSDVLPIVMGQYERQNFGERLRADVHLPGPVKMLPARNLGTAFSLMYLAAKDENRAAWEELPPLDGANRFERLKPGAAVLAESDGVRPEPLLVAGSWGDGRVLAFAGDTTWRWVMQGHEKEHLRFWRQVVLWLAKMDQSSDGNVWIKLDARRYRPGAQVDFTVGAESPEGEPIDDARFEVSVELPDGTTRSVRPKRDGGQVTATFLDTSLPGDYKIRVQATHNEEPLGGSSARFLVYQQDLELDNPAADLSLLSNLASMTGGEPKAAEELPLLLEELSRQPPDLEVETERKFTYWDTWPLLLLFVALLSVEWFLRKHWGLV